MIEKMANQIKIPLQSMQQHIVSCKQSNDLKLIHEELKILYKNSYKLRFLLNSIIDYSFSLKNKLNLKIE